MALSGTLKDFGIADILQLIGQQGKTGTLHLEAKHQEVHVHFSNGSIARAESSTRNKKDLIGAMLVRAELITEGQLGEALALQKRTLRRLGDVLVGMNAIASVKFEAMVQLQTTETLYKLFAWKTGRYAFEQTEHVELDSSFPPLRAESVLMEGFRHVDEWPVVKKKISTWDMSFQRLKELPHAAPASASSEVDDAFDVALDERKPSKGEPSVSEPERRVYLLAVSQPRTVRQLIDVSCLGEFDTCKALYNLVDQGYLKSIIADAKHAEALATGDEPAFVERALTIVGRVALALVMIAGLGFLVMRADLTLVTFSPGSASTYTDPAAQRFISRQQIARIESALALYRLEKGQLPDALPSLVEAGLLESDDLRYPWRDGYFYRRTEAGTFVLLPPLR